MRREGKISGVEKTFSSVLVEVLGAILTWEGKGCGGRNAWRATCAWGTQKMED